MASTTTAFNGTTEVEGEGLGRIADGRFVRDVVGDLPILVNGVSVRKGDRLVLHDEAHVNVSGTVEAVVCK